jgi:hypothetical protein
MAAMAMAVAAVCVHPAAMAQDEEYSNVPETTLEKLIAEGFDLADVEILAEGGPTQSVMLAADLTARLTLAKLFSTKEDGTPATVAQVVSAWSNKAEKLGNSAYSVTNTNWSAFKTALSSIRTGLEGAERLGDTPYRDLFGTIAPGSNVEKVHSLFTDSKHAIVGQTMDVAFLHVSADKRAEMTGYFRDLDDSNDYRLKPFKDGGIGSLNLGALMRADANPLHVSYKQIEAVQSLQGKTLLCHASPYGLALISVPTDKGPQLMATYMCCSMYTRTCISTNALKTCNMCGSFCCLASHWCS